MAERCTSSGNCTAGFMDCWTCPFDQIDYYNGDMDALAPVIADVISAARREGVQEVGHIVYELASGGVIIVDEARKVRAAAEARLQQ